MSQPQRPYEQIPYPTGSGASGSDATGSDAAGSDPAGSDPVRPPVAETPGADAGQWQLTNLPPEWPDVPWSGGQPSSPTPEPPPPPAPAARNPWKWAAAGLAVLLLILVAGIVGRVTAPSPTSTAQPPTSQPAPSQQQTADPDSPFAQAPLATPDPQSDPDTFTPLPGSPPTFYSGRGNASVTITKDPGPAIVQFECDKCTGNTVLKSNGPESVLVNTVGSYSGRRPIDLKEGSSTTTINVGATSDWRMTVSSGLGAARASVEGAPLTGQGDDVVIMNGGATKAHVTNAGASAFIVYVVPVQSATVSLAVNTVGAYDGTVALPAPAVVIVQSTGSWTIAPG